MKKKVTLNLKRSTLFSTWLGACSVFDIMPMHNYKDCYRSASVDKRLATYCSRTGQYLNKAVVKYEQS